MWMWIPIRVAPPAEENVGSGKSVSPCERMQVENFSACACACACWAGLGALPPPVYFWHFCDADWNCGEVGLMPLPWITPCPLGSGKFGTPFARMQAENL